MSVNDTFYLKIEEPHKSCLLALRSIILQQDENIMETSKYGMPCFLYKGKIFCYLWRDKTNGQPYMLFVEGRYLSHPDLEAGDRKRMKIFRIDSYTDLPLEKIELLIGDALNLYRNGTIFIK